MKKFARLLVIALVFALLSVNFVACDTSSSEPSQQPAVANQEPVKVVEVRDAPYIEYALAVKKGETTVKNTINAVIAEWTAAPLLASGKTTTVMEDYTVYFETKYIYNREENFYSLQTDWDIDGTEGILYYYLALSELSATHGNPPLCYIDEKNEIQGVEVAIMMETAERLNLTLEFVTPSVIQSGVSEWTQSYVVDKLLSDTHTYAVAGGCIGLTEAYKATCDFANTYAKLSKGIASRNGIYKSLLNLSGKRVAIMPSSHSESVLRQAMSPSGLYGCGVFQNETYRLYNVTLLLYETYGEEACLVAVEKGNADAVLCTYYTVFCYLKKNATAVE